MRFLAGALDMLVIGLVGVAISLFVFGELFPFFGRAPIRTGRLLEIVIGSFLLVFLYYSLLEGLWGASLGKALCRLRVVGPSRNPPGIPKALARAIIFETLPALPYWVWMGSDPTQMLGNSSSLGQSALGCVYYLVIGLLFCTARRKNGYAAVHDLVTGTRVIRRVPYHTRPVLQVSPEPAPTLAPPCGRRPVPCAGND
jgi:eukaryotic-like serine/threonine-protein kinase